MIESWMNKNAKYKKIRFLYFAFLNIHRWLKITSITPHGPDDGSVEPKHYSVDHSINFSFHLDRCYQFFYISNIYV